MAIILSQAGKPAITLGKSSVEQEDELQRYIFHNPDALPLDELKADVKLLTIAREFPTASGPIDILAVDQDGQPYVVETKLYKNPDKRQVLAQMFDYGAALWNAADDFNALLASFEESGRGGPEDQASLSTRVAERFSLDDEQVVEFFRTLEQNVEEGNFRFVVLMDRLDDRLKTLISFVNVHSKFAIFGVELEFYKHGDLQIAIPSLYGGESGARPDPSRGTRRKWDEATFFAEAQSCLKDEWHEALRRVYDWCAGNADSVSWGTGSQTGSFNVRFSRVSKRSVFTLWTNGELTLNFKWLSRPPETATYRDRFADALRSAGLFEMPEDITRDFITIEPADWVPRLGEFLKVVKATL